MEAIIIFLHLRGAFVEPNQYGRHSGPRLESGVESSRNPVLVELPRSRIESGMTTKNKYPKAVFAGMRIAALFSY